MRLPRHLLLLTTLRHRSPQHEWQVVARAVVAHGRRLVCSCGAFSFGEASAPQFAYLCVDTWLRMDE